MEKPGIGGMLPKVISNNSAERRHFQFFLGGKHFIFEIPVLIFFGTLFFSCDTHQVPEGYQMGIKINFLKTMVPIWYLLGITVNLLKLFYCNSFYARHRPKAGAGPGAFSK
jgi:hypothetical protein